MDILRAIACLMVLAHHGIFGHLVERFGELSGWRFALLYPLFQGWVGVHLFLVISGFCIHARQASKNEDRPPDFWLFWQRRLKRLYPPYLAAVLLSVALLPAIADLNPARHHLYPAETYAFSSLIHVTMLFPLWPKALGIFGNPVFWTLALEEQLYLMYFGLLYLRKARGPLQAMAIVLVVTLVFRFLAVYLFACEPVMSGAAGGSISPALWKAPVNLLTLGPARWFEWSLGFLAAERFYGRCSYPKFSSPAFVLAFALAAMFCERSSAGWVWVDIFWGISFFALVNLFLEKEEEEGVTRFGTWARLAPIGLITYSLYLIHEPLLRVIQQLLLKQLPTLLALPLGTLLVIPLAALFYRWVERPALHWASQSSLRR
ncbi:hypothetical protein ABS71_05095 [bacterium SCN 62-11]|nr:MAG: hypothetical protein ABS71_05095 [bacterium SCN 62-11]